MNRLVDAGHTVLMIEQHMDVVKMADYVVDLGPEGGHAGGEVVATGTPEDIAACLASHTGRCQGGGYGLARTDFGPAAADAQVKETAALLARLR